MGFSADPFKNAQLARRLVEQVGTMATFSRLYPSLFALSLGFSCSAEFESKPCPAGHVPDNEQGVCVPCEGGTVPDRATGRCIACEAGFEADANWQCVPLNQNPAGSGGGAGGPVAGTGGSGAAGQGGGGGASGASGGAAAPLPDVLSAGGAHTCARNQGEVRCWGYNISGQLGNETNFGQLADNPNPLLVDASALGVARQVSLGENHTCALRDDGRVLCWGSNFSGKLGSTTNLENSTAVPQSTGSMAPGVIRQVALGGDHGCALRDDGGVFCWGSNEFGQLGTSANSGTDVSTPTPQLIDPNALGVIRQLAAGRKHTCALRDDGRVLCWGSNRYGQLGSATNSGTDVDTPGLQLTDDGALGVVRQIAAAGDHTCAVRDDGRVLCWGKNDLGQLGTTAKIGTQLATNTPLLVDASALGVARQISLGGSHTCALREDGRVLCWGFNYTGQLGTSVNVGTGTPNATPQLLDNGVLGVVRQLALGSIHSCALRDDGRVLCWGSNEHGQLGLVTNTEANPSPLPVGALPAITP